MDPNLTAFSNSPGADQIAALLRWFVEAFSVPERAMYEIVWGLSVPAKTKGDRINLNLASTQALYAECFEDGWWCFVAVPRAATIRATVTETNGALVIGPGPTSIGSVAHDIVVGRPRSIARFLRDPIVFASADDLYGSMLTSRLPRPERANPEVAEFVLGESVDALRNRFASDPSWGAPYLFAATAADSRELLRIKLADALQARGIVAREPIGSEDDVLGWVDAGVPTLAVIVDLTATDEEDELRTTLGTLLRLYQLHLAQTPRLAALGSHTPTDISWYSLFADYGVVLADDPEELVHTLSGVAASSNL